MSNITDLIGSQTFWLIVIVFGIVVAGGTVWLLRRRWRGNVVVELSEFDFKPIDDWLPPERLPDERRFPSTSTFVH